MKPNTEATFCFTTQLLCKTVQYRHYKKDLILIVLCFADKHISMYNEATFRKTCHVIVVGKGLSLHIGSTTHALGFSQRHFSIKKCHDALPFPHCTPTQFRGGGRYTPLLVILRRYCGRARFVLLSRSCPHFLPRDYMMLFLGRFRENSCPIATNEYTTYIRVKFSAVKSQFVLFYVLLN